MFNFKNEIFSYNLSPNAMKVYIYLTVCQNELYTAVVRRKVIAEACAIKSLITLDSAIVELKNKGLVSTYRRRCHDGDYIANGYDIKQLCGNYTLVQDINKVLKLSKGSFAVYLYLLSCANNKSRKAYPVLTVIATVLCIAKNTVIAAIKDLVAKMLLTKANKWAGKHNLYFVLLGAVEIVKNAHKKRNSPFLEESCSLISKDKFSKNHLTSTIIAIARRFVKPLKNFLGKCVLSLVRVVQKI